jgi:hypothetical protein
LLRRLYREAFLRVRLSKPVTRMRGPFYGQNHDVIQLDITYSCTLKCFRCNRQCSQAPSDERISPGQVQKFIDESVRANRRWRYIRIIGGEPTLHPELIAITGMLAEYKNRFSPETMLQLETAGFGEECAEMLSRVSPGIQVYNTTKDSPYQKAFVQINIAPVDLRGLRGVDFSNGCINKNRCGLCLTPYGYYIDGQAGAIDRVFGFDIGRKTLPDRSDMLNEQSEALCRYCGEFWHNIIGRPMRLPGGDISKTWQRVLDNYRKAPPKLPKY